MTRRPPRRKTIPVLERWQRDRRRAHRLLLSLGYLVETCPEWEIEQVGWDIENWVIALVEAEAALLKRQGDEYLREKIANLRGMTVARGCTPAEAKAATIMADRLEAKLPEDRRPTRQGALDG